MCVCYRWLWFAFAKVVIIWKMVSFCFLYTNILDWNCNMACVCELRVWKSFVCVDVMFFLFYIWLNCRRVFRHHSWLETPTGVCPLFVLLESESPFLYLIKSLMFKMSMLCLMFNCIHVMFMLLSLHICRFSCRYIFVVSRQPEKLTDGNTRYLSALIDWTTNHTLYIKCQTANCKRI